MSADTDILRILSVIYYGLTIYCSKHDIILIYSYQGYSNQPDVRLIFSPVEK